MNTKLFSAIILGLVIAGVSAAQRPPRPQGPPGGMGGPPMGGAPRGEGPQDGRGQKGDWMRSVDTNNDGKIDAAELQAAMDATFKELDKNNDGVLEPSEMQRPPHPEGEGPRPPMGRGQDPGFRPEGAPDGQGRPQGPPMGRRDDAAGRKMLPPFFFLDRAPRDTNVTRADFDRIVRQVFAEMDTNNDGVISRDEAKPPKRQGQPDGPPPPPNARFIAAELRFGDKFVKAQPFSADTVIEDTRRLYDGTTVTKQINGAIYRDSNGRTRREQPLEMVGGFNISGSDGKPQMLVFINDFQAKTQYFLDVNNKIARKHGIGGNPPAEPNAPADAKSESLGSKTIEGVQVEGTRTTFEIPAGQLGNGKPIEVVTENWFSPELQMIVMSRHLDPLAGEHVFKLINIKRAEPAADLFTVPAGFRVESGPGRAPEKD